MAKKVAQKKTAKPAPKSKAAPTKAVKKPANPTGKTAPAKKVPAKPAAKPKVKKAAPAPKAAKKPTVATPATQPKPTLPAKKPTLPKRPVEAPAETSIPATAPSSPPPPRDDPYPDRPTMAPEVPLTVSAQGSPGMASRGNSHPANILAVVTCGGWPVTDLSEDDFTIMEHFEVPGQVGPFSNNITSFRNAGSGAYLLQVRPINHAPWMPGHHLAQLLVSSPDFRQGQTAVKIIVR